MANVGILCRPSGILKLVQIALCLVCLALISHYNLRFGGSTIDAVQHRLLVGIIACGGMVLVTVPLLIALVAGEIVIEKSFLETLYNIVGFIMLITAGAMAVNAYNNDLIPSKVRDPGLAMGSLAIINAFIYLIDAFVAFRLKRN